jgi:dipeptidyl aminopeptidase/acylaminoacyl peptidase
MAGASHPDRREQPAAATPAWLLRRAWPAAVAAFLLSCGEDPAVPELLGDLQVSLHTFGGDPDLDGYLVTVDDVEQAPVELGGSALLSDLPAGAHTIGLAHVAANCDVVGEHPRIVTILPGRTRSEFFEVQCLTTGVAVRVSEGGADLDEDGYVISVDGGPAMAIAPSNPWIIGRLEPGQHTISLSGVPANCTVAGGTSRTVTVTLRLVEAVEFLVDCSAVTGTIRVTTATTGEDFDPDGYRARLDGGAELVMPTNGTAWLHKLAPGNYTVRMEDLASNCHPLSSAQQQVSVAAGAIAQADFHVVCARTEVIAVTRGTDIRQIMLVRADGAGETPFLLNGEDVAWSWDGYWIAYRMVDTFCDWDYYYCDDLLVVANRDGSGASFALTEETGPPALSPDGRQVAFSRSDGSAPRLYIVRATGAGLAAIDIPGFTGSATEPSWSPDGTRLAFTCLTNTGRNICVVNVDGSGFRLITDDPEPDDHPAWSPDGTQLAFTTRRGVTTRNRVALIRLDGTGLRMITAGEEPTWSRDGSRLALRLTGVGTADGIYVVNADGSGLYQITSDATDRAPAWRP